MPALRSKEKVLGSIVVNVVNVVNVVGIDCESLRTWVRAEMGSVRIKIPDKSSYLFVFKGTWVWRTLEKQAPP